MKRERVPKPKPRERKTEAETPRKTENKETQRSIEDTKEAFDELLGDIDKVLENNAEEFVKAYVQKGGE